MSEDPSFSFSFPAVIARQLLSNIRDISVDTLSAHGVGMENKLHEVANSLADVILCVPQVAQVNSMEVGPRDMLFQLANILAAFNGANPSSLSYLQQKLIDCGLGVPQVSRITELPDGITESQQQDSPESLDNSLYMTDEAEHGDWLMQQLPLVAPPSLEHCPDSSVDEVPAGSPQNFNWLPHGVNDFREPMVQSFDFAHDVTNPQLFTNDFTRTEFTV
ncbi:hypothetical protein H2201_006425 [Coniosporium apollinis]|uniref:Uncharacterized protein n=2 Tax=Coniosporium TaxID=2810619 RepID=A0ABQ9NLS8_9PEZI|nr:hypothetical protein H2199_006072 [Cladosporium sp. JES 115]KAJ9661569.1 hypothetical protein H2201_006425 [Coniosporium apollinis]